MQQTTLADIVFRFIFFAGTLSATDGIKGCLFLSF